MLKRWNQLFFRASLSMYDVMGLSIIIGLATTSFWFFLLFIPLIITSVHFQLLFARDDK